MQRIEGRGLLCHCPEKLNVQDAPNESTDAASGKEDHDKSRFFFGAQYSTYATKKKRGRVSELRLVLSEGQAEADRPHGHAGHPQPYLQHGEHQEAPNNLAAGAHSSSVIIPSRSEWETNLPPSFFHCLPYPFLPLPDPKTFLSSPVKHYPQGLDFQSRRPSSLTGPEAKEPLQPLARPERDLGRIRGLSPGVERDWVPGLPNKSREARSWKLARPGAPSPAREALSRVLPRPASPRGKPAPSSSCQPSGSPSFPCLGDALGFPEKQSELLRASLSCSRWSPLLCFRGHAGCFCESLGPRAERADAIQHHAPRSCCVARKSDLV